MVLSPIHEEVANSSKKTYPIQDQSAQTKPYFIPNNMHEKNTQFWLAEKGVQLFCNTSANL